MMDKDEKIRELTSKVEHLNYVIRQKDSVIERQTCALKEYGDAINSLKNIFSEELSASDDQLSDDQDVAEIPAERKILADRLDGMIHNDDDQYDLTGFTVDDFYLLDDLFWEHTVHHPHRPFFADDPPGSNSHENNTRLYIRHVLLLALMSLWRDPAQEELIKVFETDKDGVTEYLKFANIILDMMLPTPKHVASVIRNTFVEDIDKIIVGKKIMVNGNMMPVTHPADFQRTGGHSDKKKKSGYRTIILTNADGVVLDTSMTVHTDANDLKLFDKYRFDFGHHTEQMMSNDTPNIPFMICYDQRSDGIQKQYPGATFRPLNKNPAMVC